MRFRLKKHKRSDKYLEIIGDIDLVLDFDDVDPDEVLFLAERVVEVLNGSWRDDYVDQAHVHSLKVHVAGHASPDCDCDDFLADGTCYALDELKEPTP